MITAEQARNTAAAKQAEPVVNITDQILKAAQKGEFKMYWYKPISSDARKILSELGYKVGETQFDRNEYLTEIKW